MQSIINYINEVLSKEILVFLLSMLPFIEVKGAVPVGIGYGINPTVTFIIAYLGSLVPMPFIIKLIRPIFTALKQRQLFTKMIEKIESKSMSKWYRIRKYKIFALFVFTAIPLPGTGIWSASLIASLLNLRLKHAIIPIALGNLVSTIIVSILSHSIIK